MAASDLLPNIQPATWERRLCGLVFDYALLAASLAAIGYLLPEGPPPADAMAFFSAQDFIKYFVLVGAALAITAVAFQLVPWLEATPGQRMVGLRLVSLDGSRPTKQQVSRRKKKALLYIAIIMLPGPLLALLVAAVAAAILGEPLSTADRDLRSLGLPDAVRLSIHGLSFIALAAAVWVGVIRPNFRAKEREARGLTRLDHVTHSTHTRR